MKIEFELPELLYNKLQAAITITEESVDEVMTKLVFDYISNLLRKDSTKTNPIEDTQTVRKKVSSAVMKAEFQEWFKNQRYRGKPYNPVTISGYTGRIENACRSPQFATVDVNNLFEISDVDEFRAVRQIIESCDGFSGFDNASHGGFTAALNMYDRFLRAERVPAVPAAPLPNTRSYGHSWIYAEDELCCRRYFETYIINRQHVDLFTFAETLSKELSDIPIGSLRMKLQNIKCLCIENKISDTFASKPLNQYSSQCRTAFNNIRKEFKI